MLTRDMRYDRQIVIDFGLSEFQIFSVVAVFLGAGVWGLATGSIVRAVVGTVFDRRPQHRPFRPSLRGWRALRSVDSIRPELPGELVHVGRASSKCLNIVGWRHRGRSVARNLDVHEPHLPAAVACVQLAVRRRLSRDVEPARQGEDARDRSFCARCAGPRSPRTFVFPTFAAASPQLIPTALRRAVAGSGRHPAVHLPLDAHPGLDRRSCDQATSPLPVGRASSPGHRLPSGSSGSG